jgi:tRNA(Arg) A34 adenosine deaminase TadA
MNYALDEAGISKSEGNKGYGALVLMGETVLSKAHDTAITEKDPSKHVEVNALRQAVKVYGDSNLCGAILFTTCEPCPMCTSLAIWANISAIVYSISIKDTIKLGRTRISLSSIEIIKKSPVNIEIISDVLKDKCKELYI